MTGDKFVGGVRVHHDTLRNVTYIVECPKRPYKIPMICSLCAKVHPNKTYHIALDNEGNSILSKEIVDELQKLGNIAEIGLTVLNVVRKPPTQFLDLGGTQPIPFRLEKKEVGA